MNADSEAERLDEIRTLLAQQAKAWAAAGQLVRHIIPLVSSDNRDARLAGASALSRLAMAFREADAELRALIEEADPAVGTVRRGPYRDGTEGLARPSSLPSVGVRLTGSVAVAGGYPPSKREDSP
jgi:hypothetical protein